MSSEPAPATEQAPLHVLAGVLRDGAGRVLLAERPPGKAFAGRWEFPGGKLDPGETPRAALERELREELGIDVATAEPLLAVTHRYPGAARAVLIDSWRVTSWRGTPASLDGQRLRWCATDALAEADILEADRPIVTALRLPATLAIGGACGIVVDPDVRGALAAYTTPARIAPTSDGHALAGCMVGDAATADVARARGADFLLAVAATPHAVLAHLATLGLPWYLEGGAVAPVTPTGRWVRGG